MRVNINAATFVTTFAEPLPQESERATPMLRFGSGLKEHRQTNEESNYCTPDCSARGTLRLEDLSAQPSGTKTLVQA